MRPINLEAVLSLVEVIEHSPRSADYHIRVSYDRDADGWPDAPIIYQYVDGQGCAIDKEHFAQLLVGGAIAPVVSGRNLVYVVTDYGYMLCHRIR